MQPAKAPLFKDLHFKPRLFAEPVNVLPPVYPYIALAHKVSKRHLNVVAKPPYGGCVHSHITQNKPAVRPQNTVNAVKEILYVRIMVKALAADDRIKGVFLIVVVTKSPVLSGIHRAKGRMATSCRKVTPHPLPVSLGDFDPTSAGSSQAAVFSL